MPSAPISRRLALTAGTALLAIATAGCSSAASPAPSATPVATATPSPTAAPTTVPTPTAAASATAVPTAVASQATTGRIVVAGQGFAVTLPDGWQSIPPDLTALKAYIDSLPAGSQLRTVLEGQTNSALPSVIKFWAFDVRPADAKNGFARNLNVIVQPATSLSLSAIEAQAKASLESLDAVRKPVKTSTATLPSGDALRIDYVIDLAGASATKVAVGGTQYYIKLPNVTLILSFSTDDASIAAAAADFDAMASSIESAP
jgi:hypothetical protein